MAAQQRGRRRTRDEDRSTRRDSSSSSGSTDTNDDNNETNVTNNNDSGPLLLRNVAILGDTPVALCLSFLILLLSMSVSVYIRFPEMLDNFVAKFESPTVNNVAPSDVTDSRVDVTESQAYKNLGNIPQIGPPNIYNWNNDMITSIQSDYDRDGVVAIRGLISDDMLSVLQKESEKLLPEKTRPNLQFHHVHQGVVFANDTVINSDPYVRLALHSAVARVASELLPCPEHETLRLIRDIFLTKDADPYVCGWHVDDFGFWPSLPDDVGVNAWIALDDMPINLGGSIALAVGSHTATWAGDAHYAIGAPTNTSFPLPNGYTSAQDMIDKRTGQGTCRLQSAAPHLHQRMEETMRIYDVKAGDVLFMHRWMYHRTVKMADRDSDRVYRRYSIRYGLGSSTIPPGYGTEWSVLYDPENGGRTADEIAALDGPWYPKTTVKGYEAAFINELSAIRQLAKDKMPIAQARRDERIKELQPLLKRVARQQHQLDVKKHRDRI